MAKQEPTGRKRYRALKRAFRKPLCILQIEVRSFGCDFDWTGSSHAYDFTFWRDATPEDVTTRDA